MVMCTHVMAHAQNVFSAFILDANTKLPLVGASIQYGLSKTISDKNGQFTMQCIGGEARLSISYIGYIDYSIVVLNCAIPNQLLLNRKEAVLDLVELSTTSAPNKHLLYQPQSITKLTKTELNRGTGLFLDDVIQTNVTGVSMNRRSVGGGQQLNIRGYGNGTRGTRGVSSNFDGQGSKVYLNGIPITDAEGITTFDDLDFASLQNVEIIKGPAGTLYGLAIAGAVNLTTMKPEKGKSSISLLSLRGNYGLRRTTTTFQTAGEKSSLLLNYGVQKSEGFTIHNASQKKFLNLVTDFTPSEKQNVTTYFGYSDSYDERAGELTISQFETNDYSGNPEYIKRNAHSHVVTFRAGIGHTYKFAKWLTNSTTIFGTGFNSDASSASGWTDKGTFNVGFRSVFNTNIKLAENISLHGVSGVEYQKHVGNTMGYNMKQHPNDMSSSWVLGVNPYWVINAQTSNIYTSANTHLLFSEWTLSLPEDLTITAGLGTSALELFLNDRFNSQLATRPSSYENKFKNMATPHIAINKVVNKKISFFANYSMGYKAPAGSYFYITTPVVATNPPTPATGRLNEMLKPELGTQIEFGSRGEFFNKKLSSEIIWFNTIFSNKMTAVSVVSPLSPNTTLYSFVVNGGKQLHKGIEFNLKYTAYESSNGLLKSVKPFINFTKSDFRYGNNFFIQKSVLVTEDYSKKVVAAVARYVVNAGIDLILAEGVYANMTYNYRDRMPITSLNDFYTKSYNLLNGKLGCNRNLGKHFNLDISYGLNNITNTKYFLMVFANQLPDAYVPAPRNANGFGSIQIKYNF